MGKDYTMGKDLGETDAQSMNFDRGHARRLLVASNGNQLLWQRALFRKSSYERRDEIIILMVKNRNKNCRVRKGLGTSLALQCSTITHVVQTCV